jgi:hypothetical protein
MGRRSHTVLALQAFAGLMQRGSGALDEPFWPARPGMEAFDPGPAWQDWFIGGALEQLVRAERFSSFYGPPAVDYAFFEGLAFASTEMLRRRVLRALRNGERVAVPERLHLPAPDHLNAEIWREGKIPGSLNL